ncbi:hypothetical protein BCR42DRAFT_418120, partial [Absidia repens]
MGWEGREGKRGRYHSQSTISSSWAFWRFKVGGTNSTSRGTLFLCCVSFVGGFLCFSPTFLVSSVSLIALIFFSIPSICLINS